MIKVILSLYIFCSVNDLILYAFNLLVLKNFLLGLLVLSISFGAGRWKKKQVRVFYFLIPLVCIPIMIGLISGVPIGSIFQQTFAVTVAIMVPVMVDRYAGDDETKWKYVSNVLVYSLVFMMLFKIVFVVFQAGYLSNGIFELLFRNISGRGEIDGIARLNTGTQLVMLYGLVLCFFRLFGATRLQRLAYVFACFLFAVDLFIASSRFFTVVAPLAVVLTLVWSNVKIPRMVLIVVGAAIATIVAFLLIDMYASRIGTDDGGDTIRKDQTSALLAAFKTSPVFGHGAGFSIPGLTRNEEAPFLYEVQIIAFLMQFGVFGTVLYLLAMFQVAKSHFFEASKVLPFLYFLIFFGASYFNPYMLGSYAGLSMVVIIIITRGLSINKYGNKNA